MSKEKFKISKVSALHYAQLCYRSILFIILLISYICYRLDLKAGLADHIELQSAVVVITFTIFVVEMIIRFFPFKYESPGCQKQFEQNYIKSGSTEISIADNNSAVLIALIWIVFNGLIGTLRMKNIVDDGFMILLCSAFSVCDVICILFFCPFQTLFMKNKCCSVCRIYNWNYAMMFTPLFFVTRSYMWILLALAVALLARWEITIYVHPERFSENTNEYLRCQNCTEKLCTHKKQLNTLWKEIEIFTAERVARLKKEADVIGKEIKDEIKNQRQEIIDK